jgi:hypothetical protein
MKKTVTITFVVADEGEEQFLFNEISEMANENGMPYISSTVKRATAAEIKTHKELTE